MEGPQPQWCRSRTKLDAIITARGELPRHLKETRNRRISQVTAKYLFCCIVSALARMPDVFLKVIYWDLAACSQSSSKEKNQYMMAMVSVDLMLAVNSGRPICFEWVITTH
jgi:hypothetical protein